MSSKEDSGLIGRYFDMPESDYEQFNALYPQHGAWAWWFRASLRAFLDLHTVDTPEELIELAQKEAIREIQMRKDT